MLTFVFAHRMPADYTPGGPLGAFPDDTKITSNWR